MSGLECSEVNYSQLNAEHRIDSEYFLKTNIMLQSLIKAKENISIGEIATVTDGIHTSIDYDDTSGINLISATSPSLIYLI